MAAVSATVSVRSGVVLLFSHSPSLFATHITFCRYFRQMEYGMSVRMALLAMVMYNN